MPDRLDPTEEYDGRLTVYVLNDHTEREKYRCSSYPEAIETVKKEQDGATTTKIEDKDGEIVFSSARAFIEDWEKAWKSKKRSLSISVEDHDCPYDHISCVADDLCGRCKLDKVHDHRKL